MGTLELLTLNLFLGWASNNMSITIFLTQYWFQQKFLLLGLCSGVLSLSVSACLSLSIWGQQFYLQCPFSDGSEETCWFSLFSLFACCEENFQTPYRPDQTSKKSCFCFCFFLLLSFESLHILYPTTLSYMCLANIFSQGRASHPLHMFFQSKSF